MKSMWSALTLIMAASIPHGRCSLPERPDPEKCTHRYREYARKGMLVFRACKHCGQQHPDNPKEKP